MTSISDTKEKEKLRKEKLSGYFLDMSKLTFGATVLSGILPAFKSATVVDVIYTITGNSWHDMALHDR